MPTNGVVFSDWLRREGYSPQLQKRYRDSGWLAPLGKGVMCRPQSHLSAYSALASYNKQMGKMVRISAHSALEYMGFNHYVPMGKPTLAVAIPTKDSEPLWMKEDCFDMDFRPFSTNAFPTIEVKEVDFDKGTLFVSSPELAIMECMHLATKRYSYMDLYYIMEQLTTLRSDIVQRLLETAQSLRVKRLFLYMAEKADHYWREDLDLGRVVLGSSKMKLVENGVYIPKYKITVNKELESYEG